MTSLVPEQTLRILGNIVFLKKTTLFSSMPTNDLRAVASIAEELAYKNGDTIVRERDVGDSLYLIKEGMVGISKKVGDHRSIDLARLSAGDCFGEMAAFDAELRSASAEARGDCVLLRIGGEDLMDVILDCPSIGIEMLKIFVKRLRSANATIEKLSSTSRAPQGTEHDREAQT